MHLNFQLFFQAELDRRWTEYKKDPSSALNLEEFRERIRVARGK